MIRFLLTLQCLLSVSSVFAADPFPRTLIAVYDSTLQKDVRESCIHQFAEMPLNHLGYRLDYYDVQKGLPDLTERADVAGVIIWFRPGTALHKPKPFIEWAQKAADQGKRLLILGDPGFYPDDDSVSLDEINKLWAKIGLFDDGSYISNTYKAKLTVNTPKLVNFEWPYRSILPSFRTIKGISKDITIHVQAEVIGDRSSESILVMTGPKGAFCSADYAIHWDADTDSNRHWFLNPFLYFHLAMGGDPFPKPDTTTMVGRRLYLSHIDGDGWISRSLVEKYKTEKALCAEVIYREILVPSSDLPTTVGPICADLDYEWVGFPDSRRWLAEILALDHVETAVHTFSHPFDWEFFEYGQPDAEIPFLKMYPFGGWLSKGILARLNLYFKHIFTKEGNANYKYAARDLNGMYEIPRAYANFPYNLTTETSGAVDYVNHLSPNKPVALYSWSGNCEPYAAAIKAVKATGVPNLNGGNTRFDLEMPSYGWVRPIGRQIDLQQQIYAPNSNENEYTHSWTSHYYNFNKLPRTFKATNTPLRVKPMNLYYHMYSGERLASLEALRSNLSYIRSQKIVPITASNYARIAEGFYSTEITPLGENEWAVENRGPLQTIRFDHATRLKVDFEKSKGVQGQMHFQGSLYVFLEPKDNRPTIATTHHENYFEEPIEHKPYLLDSRWPVWDLAISGDSQIFWKSAGYGKGEISFRVAKNGAYRGVVTFADGRTTNLSMQAENNVLTIVLAEQTTVKPVAVTVERVL
ncbi:MAG: hypothetical protein Q8K75_03200 [Chlamydiales bacterium]|nr:hypothetical protein [Chlamydiales bacterium]